MTQPPFHESYASTDDVKVGSERSFGIVFAVVFALIGLFPLWSNAPVRIWALIISGTFLVLAFTFPKSLKALNLVWFKFGMLLHKIVNPLIMGLVFFATIMPIGLLMRALGKRPLNLSFDKSAKSYWVYREPPAPAVDSMKRQF